MTETAGGRFWQRAALLLIACFASLAVAGTTWAHDARPLSVMIVEGQPGTYRVGVRIPPSVEADNRPKIIWPADCMVRSAAIRDTTGAGVETMMVACPRGLDGQRIGVRYPLFNPSLSTLFRFTGADGVPRTAVLRPEHPEWQVPRAANWTTVAYDYLLLGIQHIWAGIDHLLFVAGLLILARVPRRIVFAVTGFTLAHSITLSLSALNLVRLPLPPIEAGIALSILFLAREIALPNPDSLARRFPLAISSSFGLLHGFGFAAALNEAGLPQNEVAPALLFFNVGVEAGQLAFIAVALILIAVVRRIARSGAFASFEPALQRAESAGAYVLGLPAAFWFFERVRDFAKW